MKEIYFVVRVGIIEEYPSTKEKGKMLKKQNIILRELGGRFANSYVVTCWDETIAKDIKMGNVVAASLRFATNEHDGRVYQEIYAQELLILK